MKTFDSIHVTLKYFLSHSMSLLMLGTDFLFINSGK